MIRRLVSRLFTRCFPSTPIDLAAVAEAAGVLIVDRQQVQTGLVQACAARSLASQQRLADDFLTWEWEFVMSGGDR